MLVTAGSALVGCTTTTTPTSTTATERALNQELRDYLLDPVDMADVPAAAMGWAREVYSHLVSGNLASATSSLEAPVGSASVELLNLATAQVAFAGNQLAEARDALGTEPGSDAGFLLSGRLYELNGQPAEAVRHYSAVRDRVEVAVEGVDRLLPSAVQVVDRKFDEALNADQVSRAQGLLANLQAWAPKRELTLRLALRLAGRVEDPEAELDAWRQLHQGSFLTTDELVALTEMEISRGSADRALQLARALAAGNSTPPGRAELLARAQFNWRARLLPVQARAVLATESMTRADFALALYWFFPQVRYARATQVRIASDILDHPNREEIAQVVNADLLHVDRAGHRFFPDLTMGRREGINVILRILRLDQARCLTPEVASDSCAAAQACGILTAEQCSFGNTVSGEEFGNWARRAQESLTHR